MVSTQPTDFVVNLNDPVDPVTVQGSDFTVNGTPANSFVLGGGNTQITFHFNSTPVATQGLQTMHIAAGAFNKASGGVPVLEFTGMFCYDAVLLAVTTTVPIVGGTFTPAAPNNYTYDVNFNEAVDPASVQTSDLTVSGNSGPSVTAVSVINANMTARFTLHMNFGGDLTASIAAAAITDAFGNSTRLSVEITQSRVALLQTITPSDRGHYRARHHGRRKSYRRRPDICHSTVHLHPL